MQNTYSVIPASLMYSWFISSCSYAITSFSMLRSSSVIVWILCSWSQSYLIIFTVHNQFWLNSGYGMDFFRFYCIYHLFMWWLYHLWGKYRSFSVDYFVIFRRFNDCKNTVFFLNGKMYLSTVVKHVTPLLTGRRETVEGSRRWVANLWIENQRLAILCYSCTQWVDTQEICGYHKEGVDNA